MTWLQEKVKWKVMKVSVVKVKGYFAIDKN